MEFPQQALDHNDIVRSIALSEVCDWVFAFWISILLAWRPVRFHFVNAEWHLFDSSGLQSLGAMIQKFEQIGHKGIIGCLSGLLQPWIELLGMFWLWCSWFVTSYNMMMSVDLSYTVQRMHVQKANTLEFVWDCSQKRESPDILSSE